MARTKKHFVVFSDGAIYKYIPEDDDKLISSGEAQLHDNLSSAKRYAKECLQRIHEQALANIDSFMYKDFP